MRPSAATRSKPDESTWACRARPAGVLGAEVWVKLVDADAPAPTNPAALVFLTMTTRPTFRVEFKPGEGGKTAVYMTRGVNTRGEKWPWSEIATARSQRGRMLSVIPAFSGPFCPARYGSL